MPGYRECQGAAPGPTILSHPNITDGKRGVNAHQDSRNETRGVTSCQATIHGSPFFPAT